MLYDESCDFCRISRGEDGEADIVCRGQSWVAFFPLEPATPGYTLVIPRVHVPDVWSLEPELGAELMSAVVRVGRAIEKALHPEGMNLISSSGEVAGQTIFHLHMHVVPRWRHDEFGRIWPPEKPMAKETKEDFAALIRSACAEPASP